ncbi:hypothetical protein DQ04_00371050 [Trypanosoma grayi]|uniref:hypothetical protein n=1 Tax=Trypanosoma grayi TaxID=71804 RepID=UPI0004F44928|nr:hypothetical protein DQ04_00371050 [Trypanosoma grayi]KEG14619.1 hypothetical protein DQ04_00371050 [Trypanosoma grayi]
MSTMQGHRRYSYNAAPEVCTPSSARRMLRRRSSVDSARYPSGNEQQKQKLQGFLTLRRTSLSGSSVGIGGGESTTIVSGRRFVSPASQGLRRDSPRSVEAATANNVVAVRRKGAAEVRCKYCSQPLLPEAVTDHDRYCPLKPMACTRVDPRTGVVCGYICRGRDMLAKHEAQCTVTRRGSETPVKKKHSHCKKSDASDSQNGLHSTEALVCHQCDKVFSVLAELVQHGKVCPGVEVPCPLLCGKMLCRGDIEQHVREEAMQHGPLRIPNSTDFAAEDPRVVLALVMNLLLEKAGTVASTGSPTHANGGMSMVRPCIQTVQSANAGSSSLTGSRRSSLYSVGGGSKPMLINSNTFANQVNRSCISPATPSSIVEALPVPRAFVPEPIARDGNCTPLINKQVGLVRPFRETSLSAKEESESVKDNSCSVKEGSGSMKGSSVYEEEQHSITPTGITAKRYTTVSKTVEAVTESAYERRVEELLHCIGLQCKDVVRLKEQYFSKNPGLMDETAQQQLAEDLQATIKMIDAKNKEVHIRVMDLVEQNGVAPAHVMKLLERWRSLDHSWYEAKFALYDHVMVQPT